VIFSQSQATKREKSEGKRREEGWLFQGLMTP
jgi:hypothetical protein